MLRDTFLCVLGRRMVSAYRAQCEQTHQAFPPTVRIWKVAPGSPAVSACTVASTPSAARQPRIRPAGKYRNGCAAASPGGGGASRPPASDVAREGAAAGGGGAGGALVAPGSVPGKMCGGMAEEAAAERWPWPRAGWVAGRVSKDMRESGLKALSVSTKTPRWFVLRLSICLRNSSVHRSLHTNLMMSSGVVARGLSREKLATAAARQPSSQRHRGLDSERLTAPPRPARRGTPASPAGRRRPRAPRPRPARRPRRPRSP